MFQRKNSSKKDKIITSSNYFKPKLFEDNSLMLKIIFPDSESYNTKIENWDGVNLKILAPISNREFLSLPNHSICNIYLITKNIFVHSKIEIVNSSYEKEVLYYNATFLEPLVRDQKRHFFRLAISLPLTFSILAESDIHNTQALSYFEGTILNISAGGVNFTSIHEVPKDNILHLKFNFLEQSFDIQANIIECKHNDELNIYNYRVQFINMSPSQQNTLNQLIIQKQVLMIKRD